MRAERLRYLSVATCAGWGDALPSVKAGCWLFEINGPAKERDVRVTAAFNRLLRLSDASVTNVSFDAEG